MFIAVINENFDVAEESKKGKQVTNYYATTHQTQSSAGWLKRLNPYRWVPANPIKVKVENLPSNLILPMQKSLVQDYSVPKPESPITVRLVFFRYFHLLILLCHSLPQGHVRLRVQGIMLQSL